MPMITCAVINILYNNCYHSHHGTEIEITLKASFRHHFQKCKVIDTKLGTSHLSKTHFSTISDHAQIIDSAATAAQ